MVERDAGWVPDQAGKIAAALRVNSPNFDARPDGSSIELLVIHSISLPPGEFGGSGVEELFTNRLDPTGHPYYRQVAGMKVSAHFFIRRDGTLVQFVDCAQRAWHAGQSEWRGRPRCNDFSVGVELEGDDRVSFARAQYEVLARLSRSLKAAYPIAEIVGHSDIARPPGRKTDPGPNFDWPRFRRLLDNPG